jgi:hypothetical protein
MKTNMMKAAGIVVLIATLFLSSCKKEDADTTDLTPASNMAMADESYNDVNNIADEAATTGSVSYKTDDENSLLAGCATVTRDTVSTPRVTTIDFGNGCLGADGKTRKGRIIVTHSGPYRNPGTTITVTFDNYFVNDNQVTGTKTIHNDGLNNAGHTSFSVSVNGQILLANGAGTISWTSERTREWIAGESTPNRDDDQYSITGSATGTAANGDQFSATINQPLIRNLAPGCRRHFVSGVATMERTNRPTRVIDFGNGNCDDQATVTVNGVTHTITLH